jgi:hypothetical protein
MSIRAEIPCTNCKGGKRETVPVDGGPHSNAATVKEKVHRESIAGLREAVMSFPSRPQKHKPDVPQDGAFKTTEKGST